MKLNLFNVAKHATLLNSVTDTGHSLYGKLYFKFKEQQVLFSNDTIYGSIPITVTLEDGEEYPKDALLNAVKMLKMLQKAVEFTMDNNYTFYFNNDKIVFASEEESNYIFPDIDQKDAVTLDIKEGKDFLSAVKRASHFMSNDDGEPLHGLLIRDNCIASTNSSCIYQEEYGEELLDMGIHAESVKYLNMLALGEGEPLKFTVSENHFSIETDILTFVSARNYTLDDDHADSVFYTFPEDVDEFIEVDYKELLEELKFIVPFLSIDRTSTNLSFSVIDGFLHLKTVDDGDVLTTKLPLVNNKAGSKYENRTFNLECRIILQFMQDVPSETIKFREIEEEAPAMIQTAPGVVFYTIKYYVD